MNTRLDPTGLTGRHDPLLALLCGRKDITGADRTSTHAMRSNQLQLLFSTMACLLHLALRELGLAGAELAAAQAGAIRTKLLKIGGRGTLWVRQSVRRVWISLSESYPFQHLFERILLNLHKQQPQPLLVSHIPATRIQHPFQRDEPPSPAKRRTVT